MNKIFRNRFTQILGVTGWAGVGFYRGIQDYDYTHTKNVKKYNRELIEYKNEQIYTPPLPPSEKYFLSGIINGFIGSVMYINPGTCIFYFCKEFYRLEVYLRRLDGEKTKRYYNTLDITSSKYE